MLAISQLTCNKLDENGEEFLKFFLAAPIGNEGAHSLIGESFQQHGMWYSAINDVGAVNAGFYCIEGAADFG